MLAFIFRGHDYQGFFAQACLLDDNQEILGLLEGNRAHADARYVCVVSVLDAWRVIRPLARQRGVAYFGDTIEPAVLADVRAGRALLVFDICNEGPVFHKDVFDALHRYAAEKAIPIPRMVWLSQNRAVEAAYHATYQVPAAYSMIFESYDFHIKNMASMFARQGGAGEGVAAHEAAMFDAGTKDRLLLCLNATPRAHRVVTVAALMHRGVFAESLVSFAGRWHGKDVDIGDDAEVAPFLAAYPALAYLRADCEAVMGLRDLRVDQFSETGNALYDKIDVEPYRRTFFSLVTETEVTAGAVDRVTEKLIKAFCLGHPAMVVGNPRALRFVTELGFQDFAPVIGRDYDSEVDPARRMQMVFDQVAVLCATIRRDPARWLGAVREIGAHNARLAMSGRMLAAYMAMYDRKVRDRLLRRLAVVE